MSENENPTEESNESESNDSRGSRGGGSRGGGSRSSDSRGGGGRGGSRGNDRRGGGGGRGGNKGRRRRGKTYYCPKGKCFDYKDLDSLHRFVNESGKIKPRRQTGNCSRCQRELAREIKRARHLALMSFIDGD